MQICNVSTGLKKECARSVQETRNYIPGTAAHMHHSMLKKETRPNRLKRSVAEPTKHKQTRASHQQQQATVNARTPRGCSDPHPGLHSPSAPAVHEVSPPNRPSSTKTRSSPSARDCILLKPWWLPTSFTNVCAVTRAPSLLTEVVMSHGHAKPGQELMVPTNPSISCTAVPTSASSSTGSTLPYTATEGKAGQVLGSKSGKNRKARHSMLCRSGASGPAVGSTKAV